MVASSTEVTSGDGRVLTVGEIAQYYRDVVNISVPSQGKIQKLDSNVYSLTSKFDTVDCDTLESIKTQKVYSLLTKSIGNQSNCIDSVRCVSDSLGVSDLALAVSENGRFTARLRNSSQANGPKRQLLEIWDRLKLLKTIDTSDLDDHGSINTDSTFATISWSTTGDQDKLLYVCQPKRLKYVSFFKESKPNKESKPDKEAESADAATRGEEFTKREDWGECLDSIEHTLLAVLDVSNNCQITTIDVPSHSLGNPRWLQADNKIVCEAYPEEPRRLGLVYCNNRPCKLMVFDWRSDSKEPVVELKSSTESFHTPRASNSGESFVFLSNPTFGPHLQSVKLSSYDMRTDQVKSLPVDLAGLDLFIMDLPSNCFTTDDKHILFVSNDHLNNRMYLYTVETNQVNEIKFPSTGISILDFRYDIILASGAGINATPTLFVATINPTNASDVVAWHQMEDYIHLEEIEYELYKIPTQDKSSFVSAILTTPNLKVIQANLTEKTAQSKAKLISSQNQLPTVVIVHGGPHCSVATTYSRYRVFYSRLGLKVLLINYRGSLGVTDDYNKSLCGKIGQLDISDCMEAIRYLVRNKLIDPSKLIIEGGSHGGFISCHLSCQDEFKFTSAIIINPVVDLASMFWSTDIPDWVGADGLGKLSHDHTWVPSADEIVRLNDLSPQTNLAKAHVPTLMMLGTKDKRVKMFQGDLWANLLKAKGIDVQCKIYPDGHALANPDVDADLTISSAIWILNHLPRDS